MAVNIVIKEGGEEKNFTADKIRTNQVGGDTVEWTLGGEEIEDATGQLF